MQRSVPKEHFLPKFQHRHVHRYTWCRDSLGQRSLIDFCKCQPTWLHSVLRAGLCKCGARLEALLRGPTQWRMQKFLIGHQVIMIEIVKCERARSWAWSHFHLSSWDFNGQRRNT